MEFLEIDVRNQHCIDALVTTRTLIREHSIAGKTIRILCTGESNAKNISFSFENMGFLVKMEQTDDLTILISCSVPPTPDQQTALFKSISPTVVLLASSVIGYGDDTLGALLTRSFIKTLFSVSPLPCAFIFLNSGVALTTEGSPVIADLKRFEQEGVILLSCGTCLDFFKQKEKLQVGRISNMLEITTFLLSAQRIIRP